MGVVDLKKIADQEELDFYGKVFDAVFKDVDDVQLIMDETDFDGRWFVVCGVMKSADPVWRDDVVWWGSMNSDKNRILSQMRVKISRDLCEKCFRAREKKDIEMYVRRVIGIPKGKRGDWIRVEIGKAVSRGIGLMNGAEIRFGYDGKVLARVGSVEELLVMRDLEEKECEERKMP